MHVPDLLNSSVPPPNTQKKLLNISPRTYICSIFPQHIVANTVRVLHAERYSGGSSLDKANLDRITGLVIDLSRGGGGGIQAAGTRQ